MNQNLDMFSNGMPLLFREIQEGRNLFGAVM